MCSSRAATLVQASILSLEVSEVDAQRNNLTAQGGNGASLVGSFNKERFTELLEAEVTFGRPCLKSTNLCLVTTNLFAIPEFLSWLFGHQLFCGSGVHGLLMDCMRKCCFEFICMRSACHVMNKQKTFSIYHSHICRLLSCQLSWSPLKTFSLFLLLSDGGG